MDGVPRPFLYVDDQLFQKWQSLVDRRFPFNREGSNEGGKKFWTLRRKSLFKNKKRTKAVLIIRDHPCKDKRTNTDYIFTELKSFPAKDSKAIYSRIKPSLKRLNINLSKIEDLAEIDKKITGHVTRHNLGNTAGDKVSPQMLQK